MKYAIYNMFGDFIEGTWKQMEPSEAKSLNAQLRASGSPCRWIPERLWNNWHA